MMHTGIPEIDNLRATTVVGIDEAGYGAWAGSVYAAAVAVPCSWEGDLTVMDSKRMTPNQREAVFERYWRPDLVDIAIAVGFATAEEIDALGAQKAMILSHRRALEGLGGRLAYKPFVVVDGIVRPDIDDLAETVLCLPKADARVPAVSLASIIAKVTRDRTMEEAAKTYPGYGFAQHKGYGTGQHRLALQRLGPCEIHRKSYSPVKDYNIEIPPPRFTIEDMRELFDDET